MLAIILSHRIGMILTVISASISVILPRILTEEEDERFLNQAMPILQRVTWLGLVILVTSGILRLQLVSPPLIWLKLIFVAVTLVWTSFGKQLLRTQPEQFHLIQLVLILMTGTMGLII